MKTAVEVRLAAQKPMDKRVSPKLSGGLNPMPPKFAKTIDTELHKVIAQKSMNNRVSLKISGGGNPRLPKYSKTDDPELQKLISLTRSLTIWRRFNHEKCAISRTNIRDNLCSFCLTRSLMIKMNSFTGRTVLKPSEIMTILPNRYDVKMLIADMIDVISTACPSVFDELTASISCSICAKKLFCRNGDNYFLELEKHQLNEDISILLIQCEIDLVSNHKNCNGERLNLSENSNIMFLKSTTGLKLKLNKQVKFFQKLFRCKAVVTSSTQYFTCHGLWYKVQNNAIVKAPEIEIEDVLLVTLETFNEDIKVDEDILTYTGAEYQKILNLGDRHQVQTDRHLHQTDRHLATPQRKGSRHKDPSDRHLDPSDRHRDQSDRHLDTPHRSQYFIKRREAKSLQKLKKDINEDTGMDIKCCSCLELKSRGSCHYLKSLSDELVKKFCHGQAIAKSNDGKFYICLSCKGKIKSNQEPSRGLKEIYGLYEFPEGER